MIVDRVGSGLKNQDLPLLRELVPVILNHYPYTVLPLHPNLQGYLAHKKPSLPTRYA